MMPKFENWKAFALPFSFTLAFMAIAFTTRVQSNPNLLWSFALAGLFLFGWMAWLFISATRKDRDFKIEPRIVRVHWVQTLVHLSLYAYWGWYWRPVYDYAGLLLAQILFSYAFVALLAWSRGKAWQFSFGIFPIIFSTNLFLWFVDDWYVFQFLMIAVGYLGKEFITWKKDGRKVHIFNPSGFSLSLFSLVLILTATTHLTRGGDIATTLIYPPYIYVYIFVLGLIVQSLFSVTLTTLGAAIALLLLNVGYTEATGVYWFFDTNIPIAVFLGLHLLVTDPVTSPRTDLGRFIFGLLYGLAVFALAGILLGADIPGFYDKLLAVPILNISIQLIDRFVSQPKLARFRAATFGLKLDSPQRNWVYMLVWIVVFAGMHFTGFTGRAHEAGHPVFWKQACEANKPNGCKRLARMYEIGCVRGDAKECNLVGTLYAEGKVVRQNDAISAQAFGRACLLGWQEGCHNAAIQYVIYDVPHIREKLYPALVSACAENNPKSCYFLGAAHERGKGMLQNLDEAKTLYKKACDLGYKPACNGTARDDFPPPSPK